MVIALPPLPEAALPDEVAALLDSAAAAAPSAPYLAAIAAAWAYAPFLRRLMRTRPETLAQIITAGPAVAVAAAQARAGGEGPVEVRLRAAKADIALAVALADLSGEWPLESVTAALSDFADLALGEAIAAAIAERVEGAPSEGLVALALGKLGSHELNYSSDVDLILLHDRKRLPHRPRDDVDEAAARIGRRVVEIMQRVDGDGYVFRVDLRLRPSPEATPLVLPVEAAESYYQSEALTWERAAFIRARSAAGDVALGQAFLDSIRPFVWRRSLDYTAIRDIQAVSLRIRDHYAAGQLAGPGFDLKRGRGGIREVEFYAQIHQLIFGGREPALRAPATLDALRLLSNAGRIAPADAGALADAYRFFRTAEHRVQMRADEQTHRVPDDARAREELARFCGFDSWAAFEAPLVAHSEAVARRYDVVIAEAQAESGAAPVRLDLTARGLAGETGLAAMVEGWRAGKYRALRSEPARAALEAVLPGFVEGIARSVDPAAAAARLDAFLAQLPTGAQFLSLLAAHPKLVDLLGHLLGTTPTLADALARAPDLFDVILDPMAFAVLPDRDALATELRLRIEGCALEEALDRTRRWTAERRFQIGMQLIENITDPLQAALSYSDLADAAFAVLTPLVTADYAEAHGRVPGGELVVLGLGRFGGRALTAKSDLDIVYLFTGAHDTESDGRRPLGATAYFNRLAQRLTAAMSVPTAAGALYEIDTRLRPSGAQGLLAVTLDSFAAYQRAEAWTWEHMALTRARVVVGDPAPVEAIIHSVLEAPRDPAKLRQDVLSMRSEMAAHKPPQGPWDVKLARGGLVDLEFIVHYLQLRERTGFAPDLAAACTALGLDALVEPLKLMTRLLVILRLLAPAGEVPAQVAPLLARVCGFDDLPALEEALGLAKARVLEAWEAAFGEPRKG